MPQQDPSLLPLIYSILSNHIKEGQNDEQTVNRLWVKLMEERLPKFDPSTAKIYREDDWTLDRISALVPSAHETELEPHSESGPPITIRWKGRYYRIDGRRRIIRIVRRRDPGPHTVLVIDIGDDDF